jgi:hypothetical protein
MPRGNDSVLEGSSWARVGTWKRGGGAPGRQNVVHISTTHASVYVAMPEAEALDVRILGMYLSWQDGAGDAMMGATTIFRAVCRLASSRLVSTPWLVCHRSRGGRYARISPTPRAGIRTSKRTMCIGMLTSDERAKRPLHRSRLPL